MESPADRRGLPLPPRLPERASIYIAPDGTVHFGALFEGLVPVAAALGGEGPPLGPEAGIPPGSDSDSG